MLEFLEENNLLCPHQSGFHSSDSYQSQLLSTVHDVYASFDQSPALEAGADFLDISKAFDKVWQEWLLFKLQHIFFNWHSLHARLNSHYKAWSCKKKKHKKIKVYRENLHLLGVC